MATRKEKEPKSQPGTTVSEKKDFSKQIDKQYQKQLNYEAAMREKAAKEENKIKTAAAKDFKKRKAALEKKLEHLKARSTQTKANRNIVKNIFQNMLDKIKSVFSSKVVADSMTEIMKTINEREKEKEEKVEKEREEELEIEWLEQKEKKTQKKELLNEKQKELEQKLKELEKLASEEEALLEKMNFKPQHLTPEQSATLESKLRASANLLQHAAPQPDSQLQSATKIVVTASGVKAKGLGIWAQAVQQNKKQDLDKLMATLKGLENESLARHTAEVEALKTLEKSFLQKRNGTTQLFQTGTDAATQTVATNHPEQQALQTPQVIYRSRIYIEEPRFSTNIKLDGNNNIPAEITINEKVSDADISKLTQPANLNLKHGKHGHIQAIKEKEQKRGADKGIKRR